MSVTDDRSAHDLFFVFYFFVYAVFPFYLIDFTQNFRLQMIGIEFSLPFWKILGKKFGKSWKLIALLSVMMLGAICEVL
jgi:hypothetical protein